MEEVTDHFWHEHPLVLISENKRSVCYGCARPIFNWQTAYVCTEQQCRDRVILHKKCGELPSQISHSKHPQHPVRLVDFHLIKGHLCNLCRCRIRKVLGYRCYSCDFNIDITCEKLRVLTHPSHPDHLLTLMRKPALFDCDGCGTKDVDMAYICIICELWFHESCVMLPPIFPMDLQLHRHQLSLAFSIPQKYKPPKYIRYCDICYLKLDTTCWVYFCGDCRFFAHIKCATSNKSQPSLDLNNYDDDDDDEDDDDDDDEDDDDAIQFPLHVSDVCKELITPFVMREKGLDKIPDVDELPKIITVPETTSNHSLVCNYHKHPLILVSDEEVEEDEEEVEEDEEGDDDEECEERLKICDVCVTPISSPPYYHCAPCSYFIHSICYFLPQTLPQTLPSSSSSDFFHLYSDRCPQTHDDFHEFKLYTSLISTDLECSVNFCDVCRTPTTGMFYECEGCSMRMDVKCASLRTRIRHASHSHHKPLIITIASPEVDYSRWMRCHNCSQTQYGWKFAYRCISDNCDFALDINCAMMPSSIRNNKVDEHPLLLTFYPSLDHPSDFFCGVCEEEMHPMKAMYHCRQCDNSSHLTCSKTASGPYRNIKFGRQFVLGDIHPHPLTFNSITFQKRCHLCRSSVYGYVGLECASCYYVVCFLCAVEKLTNK